MKLWQYEGSTKSWPKKTTRVPKQFSDRALKNRVESTFSDHHNQDEGIPPESIHAVTLISIKINSFIKYLNLGIVPYTLTISWYVTDPIHPCNRTPTPMNVDSINRWATKNGFRFSKTKTLGVHVCSLRKMHNEPTIKLEGIKIPIIVEYKLLGQDMTQGQFLSGV